MSSLKRLFVFDFDGVLAIPWTNPEVLYPNVPELLAKVTADKNNICVVASFNPRACEALVACGVHLHFAAMRHGGNIPWDEPYGDHHRKDLSKALQITDIINRELKDETIDMESVFFFDDDPVNIKEVEERIPHIKCHLIDNVSGVALEIAVAKATTVH